MHAVALANATRKALPCVLAAGKERGRIGDWRAGLLARNPAGGDERGDALEGCKDDQLEPLGVAGTKLPGFMPMADEFREDGVRAFGGLWAPGRARRLPGCQA